MFLSSSLSSQNPVAFSLESIGGIERPESIYSAYKLTNLRRTSEMSHTLATAFTPLLHTHLYPHSTITINIHILSQDGSLLAASLNAATLALIDAGIPMSDYLTAVTAAAGPSTDSETSDPLLDLNGLEEQELPFLTIGTVGGRVSVLVMETRVRMEKVEGMIAVGVDGCKRVREILDGAVKGFGKKFA